MPPSGRISRTIHGFPVGGEEVRALRVGQFPEDPLWVQRILVMLSGLGRQPSARWQTRVPARVLTGAMGRPQPRAWHHKGGLAAVLPWDRSVQRSRDQHRAGRARHDTERRLPDAS